MPRISTRSLSHADAGRVHELDRNAVDGRHFRNQVARGAGDLGDDGAILLQQPVEQAALADVRPPDDGQRDAGMHQLAVGEARDQRAERRSIRCEPAQDLFGRRDADIVLGEIDAGFEQRDQFQQLLLHGPDPPRNRPFHLLRRDARLIQRGGFDQIADRLGLRQIDAAVEIRAQREFAGFGQPRAGLARSAPSANRSTTGEPWQEISTTSSPV